MEDRAAAAAEEIELLLRVHMRISDRDPLPPAQWQALRYFAHAPRETRTLSGFARHRRSTMGTASTTVSRLVEQGYLQRGEAGGERNVGLRPTPAGWAILKDDPLHDVADALRRHDAEAVDRFRRMVRDVTAALEAQIGLTGDRGSDGGT